MRRSTTLRPLGKALVALLALTMVLTMGCNMVGSLFGGGGGGGARELWSDVPSMDALKAENLDLPLAARLSIQAAFQGAIDYASFTTDKTPADVQAFYSAEKMTASGWDAGDLGCIGDAQGGAAAGGAVCFFTRETDGKREALAIIVAADDTTKKTQIFFARIDLSKLETPTPNA